MKTYIVYFNGIESGEIKASGHNAAEQKAREKAEKKNSHNPWLPPIKDVSVAYTEV